jgi:hypothetical protein
VEQHALSNEEAIAAIRDGKTSVPYSPGIVLIQDRNASTIDNYGFNLGVDGSVGVEQLHYGLSASAAVAQRDNGTSTEALTVAPALFGNARLAYTLGEALPTIALASSVMGPRRTDHRFYGPEVPWPTASAVATLRLTVSGVVPGVKGLAYRLSGNYVTAGRGPYVIGPVRIATPEQPKPELVPVARFGLYGSLEYEFWTER